ncbi:MAG: ABC transporter ATP-binding protein [Actinobacteria bacterium]|nr:ABC transporter ATP-binding protein [Actinomycetota bacterium]
MITANELRKSYGDTVAVDGASFEVFEGEIFGMVGPNGAGKTTIIECLEGLRLPDSGRIRVLGLDPSKDRYELCERIGVQLQSAALPERIKVGEALELFASFYRRSVDWRLLLERMGMGEKSGAFVSELSGGQRQRVFIALALVNDPDLVFMDELTTGLDPQSRRSMWDMVRDVRERGKTVVLTTHFMEEAERLCDRVAVVDQGRVVALDTVGNLISSLGAENRVVFSVDGRPDLAGITAVPGVVRAEQIGDRVIISVRGSGIIGRVTTALEEDGVGFRDLRVEKPTLEDVFLSLTGKEIRE